MMEQQLSKPERKNMDACLRRLKQELVSMKEAGDGLHDQMNSMMGALQELKLLQVQTALESLDVSGRPINRGPPQLAAPAVPSPAIAAAAAYYAESADRPRSSQSMQLEEEPMSPRLSPRPSLDSRDTSPDDQSRSQHNRSSLGSSSSSSSSSTSSLESSQRIQRRARSDSGLASAVPRRWSGYTAPQVDFCGPAVDNPPPEPRSHEPPAAAQQPRPVDLPGILYSLSREGPSLDSDYCSQLGAGQESTADDSSDWTSSLMSSRRNRQPLVLGDNVFADLVGNWLDLPELERDEREEGVGGGGKRRGERTPAAATMGGEATERPDSPAHPLRLSRSQEICRKFSLTTNIFKKFLRGVRPDRDKLLKERPGWAAELPEGGGGGGDLLLFKRPKKVAKASKAAKGGFYLPFWAAGAQQQQQQGKGGRPCAIPPEQPRFSERSHLHLQQPPFSGVYIDRRQAEKMQPLFDYNTAVWV